MPTELNLTECDQCGSPLEASEAGGLCPACLLLGGMSFGGRTTGSARAGSLQPPAVEVLAPFFSGYRLQGLVGCGGMGAVYRAEQRGLERQVAIKILFNEEAENPEFAERFRREAQALARLSHPNIIAVHDFGEVDEFFYIVMEFVDGADLASMIQSGNLSPKQTLPLVIQICQALQYAHDRGVVHRDIKPANIMVAQDGQVKIADFGLAKVLGHHDDGLLTTGDERLGTPLYMAPEQRKATAVTDHRADIYSLGVVFYEMLTGELPSGNFPPPSKRREVDVRFDEVVLKSMESEPARRYQQASEVQSCVESIRDGKSLPGRRARRRSLLAAGVVGLAVLVGLLIINSTKRDTGPMAASLRQATIIAHPEAGHHDYFGYAQHAEKNLVIVGAPQGVTSSETAGPGFVSVMTSQSGSTWKLAATLRDQKGSYGDRFGATVAASQRTLAVCAPNAKRATGSGVVCLYDRTNPDPSKWTLQQRLAPRWNIERGMFGSSVAIDAERVVVGATSSARGQGAVYIFERDAGGLTWKMVQRLTPPAGGGNRFGQSVDIEGDWLVVGSASNADKKVIRNKVCAYRRSASGQWELAQKLTSGPEEEEHGFGASLDLDGEQLAVGAYHSSIGSGTQQGAVHLFELGTEGTWISGKRIICPEASAHTHFGLSLDLHRDSLLVGAHYLKHEGRRHGAAYLFQRSRNEPDETWALASKLFLPETEGHNADLGFSVQLLGNVISIGSPGYAGGPKAAGAIFRCSLTHEGLQAHPLAEAAEKFSSPVPPSPPESSMAIISTESLVQQSRPQRDDRAGHAVWTREDVLVIGAPQGIHEGVLRGNGFVSVLTRQSGSWTEARRFTDPDGGFGDRFGLTLAGNDDYLVISAPGYDGEGQAGNNMGAVHIYFAPKGTPPSQWTLSAVLTPTKPANQLFGKSLALNGRLLAVSAEGERGETGAVYLYEAAADSFSWELVQTIQASRPARDERFGHTVALEDGRLAVGAPKRSTPQKHSSVLFFEPSRDDPEHWVETAEISGNPDRPDRFGFSLVFDGPDRLMVGADIANPDGTARQGAVYVFQHGDATGWRSWRQVGQVQPIGDPQSGNFGISMQLAGDRLYIGSDIHTLPDGTKTGALHAYSRNSREPSGWVPATLYLPHRDLQWCGFAWQFHAFKDSVAIGGPMHREPASIAGGIFWIEDPPE